MSINTFSTLKTAVSNYLKGRNDINDRIDEFIALGELRVNRMLRVEEMISTATVASAATITLPTDFLEMDTAELQSDPKCWLLPLDKRSAQQAYPYSTQGRPEAYRIRNGSMIPYPVPQDTTNIEIEYYARPATLSTSQETNSIMPSHADILLYAAMAEAMLYIMEDQRVALWETRLRDAVEEANAAAKRERLRGARARPQYGAGS